MKPQIPGVTLTEEIGVGGFGRVYRGVQTIIDRDVAVKVDSRTLTDQRDRRRFEREIVAAGRVSAHPNIVSLYDAGINADGRPYLVMELYTGGSYADRMKAATQIPTAEVIEVGIAIADALTAAHDEGILHRDVKPGNILISRYGSPALADFGLAALPRPGAEASVTLEALTPAYSAPESFALTAPSTATDIFGLGSTLYALLKGGPPRSDASGQSPALPHLLFLLNQPLPVLSTRPDAGELMKVIWRATATLPADRYPDVAQMRDDLMLIKAGHPVITPHSAPSASAPQPSPESSTSESPTTSIDSWTPSEPAAAINLSRSPAQARRSGSRTRALVIAAVVALLVVTAGVIVVAQKSGETERGTALATGGSEAAGLGASPSDNSISGTFSSDSETSSGVSTQPVEAGPSATEGSATEGSATEGSATEDSATEDSATEPIATEDSDATQPVAPVVGQCFAGLVTIGDSRTSSKVASCAESHYWESFATGLLDPATNSPLMSDVVNDSKVAAACTIEALSDYLGSEASPETYSIEVLPPREALFYQGDTGFSCLASSTGAGQVTTSLNGG